MRKWIIAAAVFAAPNLFTAAWAASCQSEYLRAAAPRVAMQPDASNTRELCFNAFAVLHSAVTRTPLYSAEHLTADEVRAARTMKRTDRFHDEDALPDNDRADLSDYVHSGYDRGHMTPSGDMPDADSQRESFSLANMAPQWPALNRGLWEEIEETARSLAERDGDIYIVTGPIFAQMNQSLNGRVVVPTGFYKAIYDPHTNEVGAYVAMNAAGAQYQIVSLAQLQQMTGVDVFPTLPSGLKAQTNALPSPHRDRLASNGRAG